MVYSPTCETTSTGSSVTGSSPETMPGKREHRPPDPMRFRGSPRIVQSALRQHPAAATGAFDFKRYRRNSPGAAPHRGKPGTPGLPRCLNLDPLSAANFRYYPLGLRPWRCPLCSKIKYLRRRHRSCPGHQSPPPQPPHIIDEYYQQHTCRRAPSSTRHVLVTGSQGLALMCAHFDPACGRFPIATPQPGCP